MATMDTIQLHGSAPANFLDIGGRVDAAGVAHSLELVAEDERVRCCSYSRHNKSPRR